MPSSLCRLVLDYLHRMTLRRIHAKQCRAALGDLERKQPTPDVESLEGLSGPKIQLAATA
jgi:hypothetical protein